MKPRNECVYYLVREMGGLGIKAKEIYFEDMLEHIRKDGLGDMLRIEITGILEAARIRGRLDELEAAMKEGAKRRV